MRCPYCGADADRVVDSRSADDARAIRRRRECSSCRRRYTTYERVEEIALVVRKRSGITEPFERAKLLAGLERAASDRVDARVLAAVADEIVAGLRVRGAEVSSEQIGLAVLDALRPLDAVAYLRFASVYEGFEDLSDFERAVDELQKTTAPKPPTPT